MRPTALMALVLMAAAAVVWFVTQQEQPAAPDQAPPIEEGSGSVPGPALLRGAGPDAEPEPERTSEPETEPRNPEPAPLAKDAFQVTGVVIDDAGDPQVGVDVVIEHLHGRGARSTTDAEGRFAFAVAVTPVRSATLVARKGERVAIRSLYFGKKLGTVDVGNLVLAAGHRVEVLVRSPCDAVPPATLVVQTEARMGSGGTVARTETDVEGRARLGPLPRGAYRIFAFGEGCGRGEAVVTLPQEPPTPVEIEVEQARDVVVTVVDGGTGKPVAGANLELTEYISNPGTLRLQCYLPTLEIAPTDENGKTTIRGLTRSVQVLVAVKVEGRPTVTRNAPGLRPPRIDSEVTEARIKLPALRTVRWLITEEEGPIPEDGTLLTLRNGPQSKWVSLPKGGRVEDGHIVIDSLLPTYIHGLAVTPDGRIARLFAKNDAELGMETSFRSPRTIEVVARYADGAPVTGMWAHLRGPGNNAVGEPVQLDDRGTATLRDLHGMKVTVYLSAVETAFGGTAIGTVDLDEGSGRVEATLARKREVLLHITLDGKPGIPATLTAGTWNGMSLASWPVEVVDKGRGLARLEWQPAAPGATANVGLDTPGWVPKDPTFVLRLEDAGSGPIERTLELVSGGTLEVRILMPKNGRANVVPQRWDEQRARWVIEHGTPVIPTPDGRATIAPLRAGRHRLAARSGGGVSAPVDVAPGQTASLTFDLSKAGMATGRIELPEGMDVSQVRVQVDGRSYYPNSFGGRQSVWSDGTFRVMLSGTEEVTLRPEHPLLVPAREGGTLKLTAPRDGLVLKLVAGPQITAKLDPAPPKAERFGEPQLLAFRGPVTTAAKGRKVPIQIEEGRLSCGSLPAGTWTLWLDIRGFVPLTLEGVEVSEAGVDLGTLSLSRGSSLRLVYKIKDGQSPPRVYVWLHALSEPRYVRGTNSDQAEVVVSGLGAGRYSVRARPQAGGAGAFAEEIEVDGTSMVERTIDLR